MVKFRNGLDSREFNAFLSLFSSSFFGFSFLLLLFLSFVGLFCTPLRRCLLFLFALILLGLLNSIQLIYLYLSIYAAAAVSSAGAADVVVVVRCLFYLGEKIRVPFIFEALTIRIA